MKSRREFVLANAAVVPALAMLAANRASAAPLFEIVPLREPPGPSAAYFPNVPVVAHTGREYLWYDDLIRARRVAINFFSFEHDEKYGVTDNLAKADRLAGERGLDHVTMISLATDAPPLGALAAYVARRRVSGRWLFLTGTPGNIELIRSFLFIEPAGPARGVMPGHGHGGNHSMAILRYGDEALARWGGFPVLSSPESVLRRFEWI